MKERLAVFFAALSLLLCLPNQPLRADDSADLPVIKVTMSEDQSIVIGRVLYEALRRSGYQMVEKTAGMRTAIADVNYGDAVILPAQTDGWDILYPNLVKVPVAIDNVEFSAYTRSGDSYKFSEWPDMAGLRLGYRWQNVYVANNIRHANAGRLITVNEFSELWDSLHDGETDAVILPRMTHFEYRLPHGVKRAGVVDRQPVYTYVSRRYAYLAPLLEKAYLEMTADGTMRAIHTNRDISNGNPIILHINSYNVQNEWERIQMESVQEKLGKDTALEYYSFNLNSNELHSQANFSAIVAERIRTEFVSRYPALVISSGNEALDFVLDKYYLLFPNMPVLFFGAQGITSNKLYGLEARVTGVAEIISFEATVKEMLRLFPKTRRIFILNDYALAKSKLIRESIQKSIDASDLSIQFLFSDNKPLTRILEDIRNFGSDTMVLIGNYLSDSDGMHYSETYIQALITEISGAPVFGLTASWLGHGTLGGLVLSGSEQSDLVASMAASLLKGMSAAEVPVIFDSTSLKRWIFDYERAERFGIPAQELPSSHVAVNRTLPIWETNPLEFWLLVTVAALLLLIICGLIMFQIRNIKMLQKIDRQQELLEAVNGVSSVLLEPDMSGFEETLQNSMGIMAKTLVDARICIWRNCNDECRLRFSLIYELENGEFRSQAEKGMLTPDLWFDEHPDWNETLSKGKCINSLVSDMSPGDQAALTPRNIFSVFVAPVILHDTFWGYVGFDSCRREILFTESETPILRSFSRMIAHAIIRHEMNQNLHDTAKKLEEAVEEANEANQAKTSFLANMSHEIRTPMNAILGITEIQLRDEDLSPATAEAFSKIYEAGDLLLNIINDILDLSKIEAGKLELTPVKYDIPSLINDTAQLNRLRYESKPVEFKLLVDENTPLELHGDELRIKQILNNILSNAFKYTSEGTVEMTVGSVLEPGQEASNDEVTIVFRVQDTGQGMSQAQLERLFDEYSRFNTGANRTVMGTGLGMSITKRLVHMMGGELFVESTPGKGTAFAVRLPQKRISSEICGADVAKLHNFDFRSTTLMKKAQFSREYMPYGSVLIVDDMESNLYVARGMLDPYGLQIQTAISGFETIDKIKAGKIFDIIFMDHMMPRMDGIEATKIIRDMGYTHAIVALTANALIGREEMFLKHGFDAFISKPIDSRELNRILNKFIRDQKPPEVVAAARLGEGRPRTVSVPDGKKPVDQALAAIAAHDIENALTELDALLAEVNASDETDLQLFTTVVHGQKSVLANIGEMDLSRAALRLEQAGKGEERAVIRAETPEFMNALRTLLARLKPQEAEIDYVISDDDMEFLREKMHTIQAESEAMNIKAAKKALAELKQKAWPQSVSEILDALSLYLMRGEIEKAVSIAKKTASSPPA